MMKNIQVSWLKFLLHDAFYRFDVKTFRFFFI
jgi:hypothetical protein